jgi:hypothetical protein
MTQTYDKVCDRGSWLDAAGLGATVPRLQDDEPLADVWRHDLLPA